jgi:uncharacterized phage infection (PIP) family protein YhgE
MTKSNTKWVSLYNKLSQTNKNLHKTLSVLKRKVEILGQCNTRLAKDNIAWAKSYNNLLANHSEQLALYNSLLERSKLKDCEGTAAEE